MTTPDREDVSALLERGAVLYSAGRTGAAAKVYRQAAGIAPDDPTVRFRLAVALWHGEHRAEEALGKLRALAADYPGNASIHLSIAQIANSLGLREEAAQAARQALADDPSVTAAWLELANASDVASDDPLPERLNAALADDGLSDKARRDLYFALARVLEGMGEEDAAFDAVVQAQMLAPRRWNGEADRAMAVRLRAFFTPGLFERVRDAGSPDSRMIFIIGMPRSGTSLLDRMLSSHPDVASVGETTGIGDVWQALRHVIGKDADPETFGAALDGRMLNRAAKTYLEAIKPRLHGPGTLRIVDKMPANHWFAPLIAMIFPEARIIVMERHPLDVGLSCFKAGFGFGMDYASDLTDLGAAYRLYADLMDHWHTLLGDRLFSVRYEYLVSAPEAEIARILDHCGLAFDAACVEPPQAGGLVKTASVIQARRPITTGSVGRWRRFEDRLTPMIESMGGMDWIAAREDQATENPG